MVLKYLAGFYGRFLLRHRFVFHKIGGLFVNASLLFIALATFLTCSAWADTSNGLGYQVITQNAGAPHPLRLQWDVQYASYQNGHYTGFSPLSSNIGETGSSTIVTPDVSCELGPARQEQRNGNSGQVYIYELRPLTCDGVTVANVHGGTFETVCIHTLNGAEQSCNNQFYLNRPDGSHVGVISLNGKYITN